MNVNFEQDSNAIIDLLEQFEQIISDEAKQIALVLSGANSNALSIFESPEYFDDCPQSPPRPKKLWGRKGIYIFVLNSDVKLSSDEVRKWNSLNRGAGFKTYSEQNLVKGDCLYLGDCVSISLYVRIRQHYSNDQSYTALKLRHSSRKILRNCLGVWAFPLKKEYSEEHCRIILPAIEKRLHILLSPKAGSSRV